MASSFLRRTLRLPFSSSLLRRKCHSALYSSIAASKPSSPLIRGALGGRSLANAASFLSPRFASSKAGALRAGADEHLKRVLQSEIDCVKESDLNVQVELPEGFPFEIIDNPGDQTIILKREFAGESIEVTVFMEMENDDGVDDEDDDSDDDNNVPFQPFMNLMVFIDKGEDSGLEFCANLNADEVAIESISMKRREDPDDQGAYQGPAFSDLDESLQESLHKYLEARGITSSLFDFLQEYMTIKDEREYVAWLKNMKEFMEK